MLRLPRVGGGLGWSRKSVACPRLPAAELRREFLLDPDVAFLNHGSFGACPRPVFERYQAWQRELEREPVDFLDRRLPDLLASARDALAGYAGCPPATSPSSTNATTGVNLAARSLDLRPGDEILATDLEYGACDLAWEWLCRRTGARYVRAPIPLPLATAASSSMRSSPHATERTRVVYVSHITSSTALVLPVEEIVARARELGLVTIVDGAHAPAHVPVDLARARRRLLLGQRHKWLCAPKGAGFLHARPEHHERVDGAIVSWGYDPERRFPDGSRSRAPATPRPGSPFPTRSRSRRSATGTPSANAAARSPCEARKELCELARHRTARTGGDARPDGGRSPPPPRSGAHRDRLFDEPPGRDPGRTGPARDLLRLSVAAYTTRDDIDRLLSALARELDAEHRQDDEQRLARAASRRRCVADAATPAAVERDLPPQDHEADEPPHRRRRSRAPDRPPSRTARRAATPSARRARPRPRGRPDTGMRARQPGYASPVEAAGNYRSGDDYVVEFLGYRFSFNSLDFEERVTAAAVQLGLVPGAELDDDETADLVELVESDAIASPGARSASTSSPLGRARAPARRVARLLAEEARLPRRLARPPREGGTARGRLGRGEPGLHVRRHERRTRAARAPPHAELARAPVQALTVPRWYAAALPRATSRRCSPSTRRSGCTARSGSASSPFAVLARRAPAARRRSRARRRSASSASRRSAR